MYKCTTTGSKILKIALNDKKTSGLSVIIMKTHGKSMHDEDIRVHSILWLTDIPCVTHGHLQKYFRGKWCAHMFSTTRSRLVGLDTKMLI